MEDCKDEMPSIECLFKDSFSSILACLEIILFSTIKQISKSFLLTKDEQELFFLECYLS